MSDFSKIKENRDFSRIYRRGKNFVDSALVTYVTPSRSNGVNIGITTSKKIGNAVTRSRARRVITAAFRSVVKQISGNWDIVFVSRSLTPKLKSTDIEKIMLSQLFQAGLIKGDSVNE